MATYLWNNLLRVLKSLWISLCNLCHRHSKRDRTTVLPIASPPPITSQGIVINICAPPEDLLAVDAPSTLDLGNSSWILSKQEFLRKPSLSRPKPRPQGEKQERRHAAMPDICVQNWDDLQSKVANVQEPLSGTLVRVSSLSPSPLVLPALDAPAVATCSNILDNVVNPPHSKPAKLDECLEPNVCHEVSNGQGHGRTGPPIIESSGEILKTLFEPITYAHSALSAVSECKFWDIPSDDAARMVPLPLYTSTPPRLSSRISTDHKDMRLSLLPYADLFDFSMYNSGVSQDNLGGFFLGGLPPDVTAPLAPATESYPIPQPAEVAYRDQYRNPAYSKPTGLYLCKPVTPPVKPVPASSRFSSSNRKHLREISLNSIALTTPLAKRMNGVSATDVYDSSFSRYSQSSASSGELSTKSLEDIGTRLHAACNDLARYVWTDEESL